MGEKDIAFYNPSKEARPVLIIILIYSVENLRIDSSA
jgi:hypothetical protein